MAAIFHTSFFGETFGADLDSLPLAQKVVMVQEFWPISNSNSPLNCDAAYTAFISCLKNELFRTHHHQGRFAVETLGATMDLIRILRKMGSSSLSDVLIDLSGPFLNVDKRCIQRSLELSIRLWLTINVNSRCVAVGPTFPREVPLDWAEDVSLEYLIQERWKSIPSDRGTETALKVDAMFTAAYLVDICGMTLEWTDYLTDHLKVDQKGRILTVYKHKVCLLYNLEAQAGCPIPRNVLKEALDTLNLLFPFGDPATKDILAKNGQITLYQLGNCKRERQLDLSQYAYWGKDLKILVDTFNRPPRTWKQLATDTRDLKEWAAFWVTVMVAILTIISIPCNIIQATYSVKAYNAAIAQGSNCPRR